MAAILLMPATIGAAYDIQQREIASAAQGSLWHYFAITAIPATQ
jgi:hypothetical protein